MAAEPGVDNAPLYIAYKDGLFAKAGLKVTIKTFGSAAADLAALRSGKADIGFGDYVDYFYSQDVRHGLVTVADGYNAAPGVVEVLTLPHSGIYTPQSLAHKIIGTAEPQGIKTDPRPTQTSRTASRQWPPSRCWQTTACSTSRR